MNFQLRGEKHIYKPTMQVISQFHWLVLESSNNGGKKGLNSEYFRMKPSNPNAIHRICFGFWYEQSKFKRHYGEKQGLIITANSKLS